LIVETEELSAAGGARLATLSVAFRAPVTRAARLPSLRSY